MTITNQKIAIIGENNNFCLELLAQLSDKKIPSTNIFILAPNSSLGREISYGENDILKFSSIESFDFSTVNICIVGKSEINYANYIKKALDKKVKVIDNNTQSDSVIDDHLIIPGVNNIDIKKNDMLFKIPSNPTIHLLHCLNDIHDKYGISKLVINCNLSVSEFSKAAMDELYRQTKSVFTNDTAQPINFSKRIAFNLIPTAAEETQLQHNNINDIIELEINKILGANIAITVSSFIAPIFIGNIYSVYFETEDDTSTENIANILKKNPMLSILTGNNIMTPVEAVSEEVIYVSQIKSNTHINQNNFNMTIATDNIKNGAAKSIIEILKLI
jgi:aspartate-semialdehyde dehydrogenase